MENVTNGEKLESIKSLQSTISKLENALSDGHAKWFTIPQAAAGKTMIVALPVKSMFVVYDEKGVCVNFTVVSGNNKVKLPKNGTIVFAGAPNSEFAITLN